MRGIKEQTFHHRKSKYKRIAQKLQKATWGTWGTHIHPSSGFLAGAVVDAGATQYNHAYE